MTPRCTRCRSANNPRTGGKWTCDNCLFSKKVHRSARIAAGFCAQPSCARRPVPGLLYCPKHREANRLRMKANRLESARIGY